MQKAIEKWTDMKKKMQKKQTHWRKSWRNEFIIKKKKYMRPDLNGI